MSAPIIVRLFYSGDSISKVTIILFLYHNEHEAQTKKRSISRTTQQNCSIFRESADISLTHFETSVVLPDQFL